MGLSNNKLLTKQQWDSLPAHKKSQMKRYSPDFYNYYQKRYEPARQKNYGDEPTKDTLDENATLEGFWAEKAKETTATLERLLGNTGADFLEIQINMLGKQIVAGAATVENPLTNDSFLSRLGFDVSSGKNKKILTDIFGENDTISAYQLATSLGYTKKQFTSIPAQAQRITAETPAMRELFKDQDYKATPFELEDAVLNGKTAEEVAEYVDPRYVTEAEAIAAFEAENGYRPSPEEVQDRIGQAEYTDATDAAGQEAYVNRTANHEQAELDDLKTYVDQRQITVDEVKDYAAQNGLTISDEEAKKLARQGSLEEILDEGQKIFDDFDERFVTRAELEGIARAEGYDPASLTEEDYAEFSGETSQSDAVKAIDTRATTEEELIEVFEQRTGIALDPYNPEDREKLKDMMEAATAANGGVVPSDAEFKAWTKKNIEYDLGVQVERLATSVRNAIFGTGPGGRPKTLQEILDELLGPPGTAGFGGKSPLVIKTTPGGAIGAPSTGVFGSPNVQVEIKFPVPLPVNGPPIIVPLYEEGVYVGPSSAGELLVGEDGVITQVKDNVTTTVGRISGQVVQVVGAAGEVVKAIPLGALDNPGWREGDPNPNDLVLDESGSPALIDENGNPLDKETGLPVYEAPDDADADNTFDLEDQDGDGIPDAIDPEVTVVNGEDPETKSPYDSGEASDAFRNSSWPVTQTPINAYINKFLEDNGLEPSKWPAGNSITRLDGSSLDADGDGMISPAELIAAGITRELGFNADFFLTANDRFLLGLESTLDGLGLDVGEIETILGRIETDLQNVTTAEDLETFRTNLITELLDPDTGLPSMGIDADELEDALDPITDAIGNKDEGTGLYGYISGIRDDIVQNYIGSPANGDTPATGIYLAIDQGETALNAFIGTAPTVDGDGNLVGGSGLLLRLAQQDVAIEDLPAAVEQIVGAPADGDTPATGIYKELGALGITVGDIEDAVGNKDEGTGLYGYISGIRDDIVQNYIGSPANGDTPATGIYLAIDQGETALNAFIGTAPTVDGDGNLVGGSGLLLRLAQQDVAIEDLPAAVEQIVGAPADGDTPATGIYKELGALGITVGDIEDAVGNKDEGTGLYGYISGIRDDIVQNYIGSPADGDTPATGIYLAIDQGGTALNAFIGTAPTVDGDGNLVGGSGLLLRLAQQDVAIEDLPAAVEQIVGAPADGDTPATGIYKELGALGITVGDIEDAVGNKDEGTGSIRLYQWY
jgi:hypothetical protein